MNKFWFIGDFVEDRARRIGASDIPALIPNPENGTETLAGYGRTPVTVWQEKKGIGSIHHIPILISLLVQIIKTVL